MAKAKDIHGHRRALVAWWGALRFRQLFLMIVIGLLAVPLLESRIILSFVFQFIFLNALLVAMSAGQGGWERVRRALLGLWAAGLLIELLHAFVAGAPLRGALSIMGSGVAVILAGICVVVLLRYVLAGREVDAERIFASMVAYFLVAIMFASLYSLLLTISPDSFNVSRGAGPGMERDMLYFSFVTIATLGYGDVVPQLPFARMLSVLEAVAGQFYIAVVIAWLVSSYTASRRHP